MLMKLFLVFKSNSNKQQEQGLCKLLTHQTIALHNFEIRILEVNYYADLVYVVAKIRNMITILGSYYIKLI